MSLLHYVREEVKAHGSGFNRAFSGVFSTALLHVFSILFYTLLWTSPFPRCLLFLLHIHSRRVIMHVYKHGRFRGENHVCYQDSIIQVIPALLRHFRLRALHTTHIRSVDHVYIPRIRPVSRAGRKLGAEVLPCCFTKPETRRLNKNLAAA